MNMSSSNYIAYLQRFTFMNMNIARPGFNKVICWIYIYIYIYMWHTYDNILYANVIQFDEFMLQM